MAYGAQKKVTLTGSISSVNTDELLKVPTASIGNMLSGVLSGVSSNSHQDSPVAMTRMFLFAVSVR